jgi:hypothetical protein
MYSVVWRKNLRKSGRLEFLGCEERKCENRSQRNRMGRSGPASSGKLCEPETGFRNTNSVKGGEFWIR